jgi:hypothetical protein
MVPRMLEWMRQKYAKVPDLLKVKLNVDPLGVIG